MANSKTRTARNAARAAKLDSHPVTADDLKAVSKVIRQVRVDGVPGIIHYYPLPFDFVRDDLVSSEGESEVDKVDKAIDVLEQHLVNQDGSQMMTRDELEVLPQFLITRIMIAMINARSIEDEKND